MRLSTEGPWALRRAVHRRRLRRLISSLETPVLVTAVPGNIGDHLIASGVEATLGDLFSKRVPLKAARTMSGTTLVIPGSGAWCSSFHEWLPDFVDRAAARFHQVVVLPSSFETSIPEVRRALSHENVIPIARELVSHMAISAFRSSMIAMDCAVYAPLGPFGQPAPHPSGHLLCLRTDAESALEGTRYGHADQNRDISATAPDLESWLATIRSARRITTDRAHVMIAGVLMGKRVRHMNGNYPKVEALATYTFGPLLRTLLRPVTVDELVRDQLVIPE